MNKSVVIIAHNEEENIEKCILSLLNQTEIPNEIILIAHNCTDKTPEIAKKYPIKIVEYSGPHGIIHARIEGLKQAQGDIILCIDGDSFASKNWVEVMTKTLSEGNVLVGSYIKFNNAILKSLINLYFLIGIKFSKKNKNTQNFIWGPSFAFWSKDKEFIEKVYFESEILTKKLSLSRNPEDYWLALFMKNKGELEMTDKTSVNVNVKEKNFLSLMSRMMENRKNSKIINNFLIKSYDMKKIILSIILMFCVSLIASAHQPRLTYKETLSFEKAYTIQNPDVSQAFYGEFKNNQPEHYSFKLLEDSSVYLGVLVPENNNKAEELSAMVISINPPLSSISLNLDGKNFAWKKYYEEFAGDNYLKGPEDKKELRAGEYMVIVTSKNNTGKYVLVIGEKESFPFKESIKTILNLPALKMVFFGTSFFKIFSGIIGKGLFIITIFIIFLIVIIYKILKRKILLKQS